MGDLYQRTAKRLYLKLMKRKGDMRRGAICQTSRESGWGRGGGGVGKFSDG